MNVENKIIVYYISDHGFGHASRNIPIIRYILEAYNDIKIIIKTGKSQGEFIKELLEGYEERVDYYLSPMDVGLVLSEGSLDIDKVKLEENVKSYIESFEENIKKEIEFLQNNKIDLIISDIVPWVFKCSKTLKIPSIMVTNFTWVDIYKEYLSEELVNEYIQCYKLVDKALFYELYMEDMEEYIDSFEKVSLSSREFDLKQVDKIKKKHKNEIVFVSVGRSVNLNESIEVENLPYDFIVTEGISLKGNNVEILKRETNNTQDYIKASDYIITKAGFGTLSEMLLAGNKCAVLSRDGVAEDRNSIKKLRELNRVLEVKYEDEFNMEKILNNLRELKFNTEIKFSNDYRLIGEKIVGTLRRNRYE